MAWMVQTGIRLGAPPLQDDAGIAERFKSFGVTKDYHHKVMGDKNHWWVATLAVAPAAQGKGVGTTLLKQAKAMADREGQSLYLECTDNNVSYYTHHGFQLRLRYFLEPESDISDSYPMNAMVYDPPQF
jgi:GNAT superfamily N-acetyltransferase